MESALQTSNFDSVGRDRIWIGQQSLALPVSTCKVPCRRESPDYGWLPLSLPLCYAFVSIILFFLLLHTSLPLLNVMLPIQYQYVL